MTTPKSIHVYCAPDAQAEQVASLREEIRRSLADTSHFIVTNFQMYRMEIPCGVVIFAEDANEAQMEALKADLEKAWGGSDEVLVYPFDICVQDLRPPQKASSTRTASFVSAHLLCCSSKRFMFSHTAL